MKITFIISSLGSGGAERVLSILANTLVKKYKVDIITFSNEDSFYKLDKDIKHIKLNLLKNSKNEIESLLNTLNRVIILKRILKQSDANVNISFMTHTNILSIIASRLNKQKIIISERILYSFYNSKTLNFVRKIVYPYSNMLIIQTNADKKNYNFMKKIAVIHNPIENKISENKDIKKENIILAVGRLDKQKGFENLINIYSKINTEWKLYIAGEGIERKNLENLIKKLNLEGKIILLGKQKDIFKWYQQASIFVLSSQKEGFPNVLIEAMNSGCAVISYDCPHGPSEIIENNVNGILVENQNKIKLKSAMELLIKDKELRYRLSNEAIKVKEKYCIDNIIKEWDQIIKKIVNE